MDPVEEHRQYGPRSLAFAVLTVSDSRTDQDDDSGRTIADLAIEAGHRVVERGIVPDEVDAIREAVEKALSTTSADVVVLSGGTGFSPRDVTVDAVAPLFAAAVEGFGELFRALSYQQVGPAAMLSRATAGVVGSKVIFVLPGSPKAVGLAMTDLILPEVTHLLGQIRR